MTTYYVNVSESTYPCTKDSNTRGSTETALSNSLSSAAKPPPIFTSRKKEIPELGRLGFLNLGNGNGKSYQIEPLCFQQDSQIQFSAIPSSSTGSYRNTQNVSFVFSVLRI